jgi:hypothetical protein
MHVPPDNHTCEHVKRTMALCVRSPHPIDSCAGNFSATDH